MLDSKKARLSEPPFERIVQTLTELDLPRKSRLWIAFSGGIDSTVLLHAAARAFDPDQLAVLHINHGLSSNADLWAEHCETTAARLKIMFVGRRICVTGQNLEFEGRRARFRVFDEVVRDVDVVATAHHRDDEVESLMWQLSTGRALVGIAKWRKLAHGRLWRPLLSYKRDELLHTARQSGWSWVEDESNFDISLTRNALRQGVLPQLRAAFPNFDSHLLQLKAPPLECLPAEPIDAKLLRENPTRVRAWLHAFDITPKTGAVEEIARQTTARDDAQVLVRVSSNSSVRRFKDALFVVPDAESVPARSMKVGERHLCTFGELTWAEERMGLALDSQIHTVTRKGGEVLRLHNRCVKLSKWFYDQRVPPWERDAWPLFYVENELVAVPGLGVAASASELGGWVPKWQRIFRYSR
ncbi:MAG: tRNA lysidine(34) synthetase TilS [Gammaproteobacteria bacterium]|nr:tRNA lysidine(34) synthetase TilS [Gammaproteobacteria bacterium]